MAENQSTRSNNLDGSGRDSSNNGGNGGIYTGGALLNAGKSISESNIRLIISAGKNIISSQVL